MAIKYDVHEYQTSYQLVRNARNEIDKLPENIRDFVLMIGKQIARGTYLACKSVFEPTTNPNKVKRAGSDSDFETDKKRLAELENLF